jgi:host factor-I protein
MVMPRAARRRPGRETDVALEKPTTAPKSGKIRPPEQTFAEVRYLKYLIERQIPVRVKLCEGDEVTGVIEYYDRAFIRVTRQGEPNLFIYKHDIKYIVEEST